MHPKDILNFIPRTRRLFTHENGEINFFSLYQYLQLNLKDLNEPVSFSSSIHSIQFLETRLVMVVGRPSVLFKIRVGQNSSKNYIVVEDLTRRPTNIDLMTDYSNSIHYVDESGSIVFKQELNLKKDNLILVPVDDVDM